MWPNIYLNLAFKLFKAGPCALNFSSLMSCSKLWQENATVIPLKQLMNYSQKTLHSVPWLKWDSTVQSDRLLWIINFLSSPCHSSHQTSISERNWSKQCGEIPKAEKDYYLQMLPSSIKWNTNPPKSLEYQQTLANFPQLHFLVFK